MRQLVRLYDFENTSGAGFFRGVGHGNIKFSLISSFHEKLHNN